MRSIILGGSGRTGKLVIQEVLERGHSITALVRDPSSLTAHPGLAIVQGTPTSMADIEKAVTAVPEQIPSVAIVTLNARRGSDSPFSKPVAPPRFMADCNVNLMAVMKHHGVGKLVVLSAAGTADSFREVNWLVRLMIRNTNMRHQYLDHDAMDEEVKESGLEFVLVRPGMLVEGEAKPVREWGNQGRGMPMMAKITRKSVAKFLSDAVEKKNWNGRTPVIAN
ncbi:MAG: hypothetical protein M1821_003993 [Bathelium mastoideum]|nr:MAG: hypothetical protein M1821_003993 [Bathelium mastoideum]